jgi:hypothetical protein
MGTPERKNTGMNKGSKEAKFMVKIPILFWEGGG